MTKNCFSCGKEIKELYANLDSKSESYKRMWSNGIVSLISANYGSEFDGDMFAIALCDECINKNKDKLEYIGNYMGL